MTRPATAGAAAGSIALSLQKPVKADHERADQSVAGPFTWA
ncbi:hypothetical protein [Streptomyces sp. NBC_01518]|jgi:hypothetical protein